MKTNLAIISPSQNAYSETFIQAHKQIPGMNIYFYYGGMLPTMLEGKGALASQKIWSRLINRLNMKAIHSSFSVDEDALVRSLRKEKIDCVLAEYGTTGVSVLNVCRRLKLPLVVIFLGFDASMHQILQQYGEAYRDLFCYASAVIVVSRDMQKKVKELGCPDEKICYSPCGPHDIFFKVEPTFSQELFVSAGRFVDKKAHYYSILAFSEVLKKYPEARLVIAGDGVLFNVCINLVRYLKIEHAVSLPGTITLDEFSDHLTVACAYVQHSVTALNGDMEGTPVAVMEASAAGLPVISTHHAGIPDVIIDGETGFLVDEHDVESMSKQMMNILEDMDSAKKMGAKGKKFILENFSREKHLGLIAQAVKHAVAARR